MSGQRPFISALVLGAGLITAACGEAMPERDGVARNCKHAGEGERIFTAYQKRLSVAEDWDKLGWMRQVTVTKWLACRHKLASHAPLDDCLDRLAFAARERQLPFADGLKRCVDQALKDKAS